MTLTYAELCAGYGGLGLAIEEVFGAELAWFSEFDKAPSEIMHHHWPGVPNYGDMTKIDWAAVEPVDIISGGTPCQDLSHAGRRAGMTEGTRSNLWVQMREAIATIKPTYVVWENVRGAYSAGADSELEPCPGCVGDPRDGRALLRALGRVLGDLSDLGYDAQWRGLRAADVGAPHGRFRVFVVATLQNANLATGSERRKSAPGQAESGRARADTGGRSGTPAADADHAGPQGPHHSQGATSAQRHGHLGQGIDWGEYAWAVRRWEAVRGAAPAPIESTPRGGVRLSAAFAEWMMGLPAGWVTDIDISRNEQLKALGNGVVPQQAVAALRDMLTSALGAAA